MSRWQVPPLLLCSSAVRLLQQPDHYICTRWMPHSLSPAGVFPQIGHLETMNLKDANLLGILLLLPFPLLLSFPPFFKTIFTECQVYIRHWGGTEDSDG